MVQNGWRKASLEGHCTVSVLCSNRNGTPKRQAVTGGANLRNCALGLQWDRAPAVFVSFLFSLVVASVVEGKPLRGSIRSRGTVSDTELRSLCTLFLKAALTGASAGWTAVICCFSPAAPCRPCRLDDLALPVLWTLRKGPSSIGSPVLPSHL